MALSLRTVDREKVNIRPNEFVVSVVANRPHNRLIENDIQMAEYMNAIKLQDLADVGDPEAPNHQNLPGGDVTEFGENTPNILVRNTNTDQFLAKPLNQEYFNILRPSLEEGKLRIGTGYWTSFLDMTKSAVIPLSISNPIYYEADQGKTAPFWEYLCMESSVISPVVYETELEAAASPGVYIAAVRTAFIDGENVIVEVIDKRPILSPTSAATTINLTGNFVDTKPWVETHYITTDVGPGATIQTSDPDHTFQPETTLVVYHNRGRLTRCDDYVEVGNRSIRLLINLREGDKVTLQHLIGVNELTVEGFVGEFSPSYTQRIMEVNSAPGMVEDVGFPFEAGLGWLQVFRNGQKLNPVTDYRENEDDRTIVFLIDLYVGDLLEYHYAIGFTRLFAAAGAPDIVKYGNTDVPFNSTAIVDISDGFGVEDIETHDPDDAAEITQIEADLEIASSDGIYTEGGRINLFVDWDANLVVWNAYWKGSTTAISPYSNSGTVGFSGNLATIETECGEVVLYAELNSVSRMITFLGIKEYAAANLLDADQTLVLTYRIHSWKQRSNSRSRIIYITANGTYPLSETDRNNYYYVSADAVFSIPASAQEGVVYHFIKANSSASVKVQVDAGDEIHGLAGGYILSDDTRDTRATISVISTTPSGVGLGPTAWNLFGGDGRWKLNTSVDVLSRSLFYGPSESAVGGAGNYLFDTRDALGVTDPTTALNYADAALGILPDGSEIVVISNKSQSVYNGNSGSTVIVAVRGSYIKQGGIWEIYN